MFSSASFGGSTDWFGPDVTFLAASREPCPVCGHPTGDCTGEAAADAPPVRVQFAPLEQPKHDDPEVLVEEDIWTDVQITSLTKTRVLVARAGTYLPLAKARELGIA